MAMPLVKDTAPQGINIEAWSEYTARIIPLSTASVAATIATQVPIRDRPSVSLDIPLDAEAEKSQTQQRREAKYLKARIVAKDKSGSDDEAGAPSGYVRRRSDGEPRRRDSMKRREALLKGKEGSRRRQKWENDRLLGNPAFQPPEPHDWAPHPTHSVQNVPYVLAPLWDHKYADASKERQKKRNEQHEAAKANDPASQVPRDVREKLKRARGAKALLQDLEDQIRSFIKDWEDQQRMKDEGWDVAIEDSSDDESIEEEVVFVGRRDDDNTTARPKGHSSASENKLVFDSLLDDHGASFGRWLVHCIASYYNLRTWSRTTGDPARREAYVGIPEAKLRSGGAQVVDRPMDAMTELPRPLYVLL